MENYLLGGLATAAAATFSNPFDVAKTRLQIQGEMVHKGGPKKYRNVVHCIYTTYRNEGVRAVQKGLLAAYMYQFFMNGVRLGTYSVVKDWTDSDNPQTSFRFLKNVATGASSGMLGALVASPFYLAKTRLQAAGGGTGAVSHNYRGIWDVLQSVYGAGGVRGLFAGASAAQLRIAFGSGAQLSTYDLSKRVVTNAGVPEGWQSTVLSACVSGLFVSVMMNPADTVSTRMYNSTGLYPSVWACVRMTVRNEGVLALYKGMSAQYARIIPHTLLTFLFWEELKKLYGQYMRSAV